MSKKGEVTVSTTRLVNGSFVEIEVVVEGTYSEASKLAHSIVDGASDVCKDEQKEI